MSEPKANEYYVEKNPVDLDPWGLKRPGVVFVADVKDGWTLYTRGFLTSDCCRRNQEFLATYRLMAADEADAFEWDRKKIMSTWESYIDRVYQDLEYARRRHRPLSYRISKVHA